MNPSIETKYSYVLNYSKTGFMSLEFLVDYKNNQNSTKFDVYGFGVTVFILITGKNPFVNLSEDQICESAKKGNRPKFPTNTKSN